MSNASDVTNMRPTLTSIDQPLTLQEADAADLQQIAQLERRILTAVRRTGDVDLPGLSRIVDNLDAQKEFRRAALLRLMDSKRLTETSPGNWAAQTSPDMTL